MSSIDDRIVQMTFDNAAFEKRIEQTLKSLDALDQKMKFEGAGKGLEGLTAATRNFNLGGMSASIDGISKKFLALSTIAITVLADITRRAVDAGIRIVKSLSLDPIIGGFQEYETNMKSIQTILANTKQDGTNLDQVNAALDELNSYADLTIYNFAEMARNIGTFTAAGVELDTSVQSIKGIANLAAISGSTSQQASTAMYQLSQAISSGTLRLQDWNSVVNAGMGGEVFQRALFESGKALQTIEGVPIDQTFDEWTAAGNTFRSSLESQWLTSEVLTTTLQGFTGEMTEAQLTAKGFTAEQIKVIQEMGQTGVEAATKVRTLTQLFDTAQEAVGSGWSATFRILLGDFEEATELFTGISTVISDMVDDSASARNDLLQGWKNYGGRDQLIESLSEAFQHLAAALKPIKAAFRSIFPRTSSADLKRFTNQFEDFVDKLKPSFETIKRIRRIFDGFFSAIKIGATFVKEAAGFLFDFFGAFTSFGDGSTLERLAKVGDFFVNLRESLVDNGGIENFFDNLRNYIEPTVEKFNELKQVVLDFVAGFTDGGGVKEAVGNAGESLQTFMENLGERFEPLLRFGERIRDVIAKGFEVGAKLVGFIKDFVSEVISALADAFVTAEYDSALDVVNTGILGIFAAAFAKLATNGFDIGGGFFEGVADTLEEVSGVLSAMQTDLRAKALLKIAGAIALLTASVVVLASIDSASLTKALTAMTVGFGQLVGAMMLMSRVDLTGSGAIQMVGLASAIAILAGSMLLLAVAAKIFATMDWEEMAKGLVAIGALLVAVTATAKVLSANSSGMFSAGAGIFAIAAGMLVFAVAMQIFATMEWEEIGKGLAATAGGLVLMVAAINLLPPTSTIRAGGVLIIAAALNLLAGAMKIFATMSWEEIGKGLTVVAAGLAAIAVALNLIPPTSILSAGSVLIVAGAMYILAKAFDTIGQMSWEEIGKGMAFLAGSLTVFAVALKFMSSAVLGATSLVIAATGIFILAKAMQEIAKLSVGQIVASLVAIAAALAILGVGAYLLTPVAGTFIALGIALGLAGAGMFLFGLGVASVVKAIETLVGLGDRAVDAVLGILGAIIALIPDLAKAVGEAFVDIVAAVRKAVPDAVAAIGEFIYGMVQEAIRLLPEFAVFVTEMIQTLLDIINEKFPEVLDTLVGMLLSTLTTLRDNIGEITTLVVEIITNFLDALAEKVPEIIDSVFNLLMAIITGVIDKLVEVIELLYPYGVELLGQLWEGIKSAAGDLKDWFLELPGNILEWLGNLTVWLFEKGLDLLTGFWEGVQDGAAQVVEWFTGLPDTILGWIGVVTTTLLQKGLDFLAGFWQGIKDGYKEVREWFKSLPQTIREWIGTVTRSLATKGYNFLVGLYNGMIEFANDKLIPWFTGLPGKIRSWIGDAAEMLVVTGRNIVIGLWNGIVQRGAWLTEKVWGWIRSVIPWPIRKALGIESPSKLMAEYGGYVVEGLALGIETNTKMIERASSSAAAAIVDGFEPDVDKLENSMARLYDVITSEMEDIDTEVRITPVLDLTNMDSDTRRLQNALQTANLTGALSLQSASDIASTQIGTQSSQTATEPSEIKFEQTINAPKQLSTADIYRQTKNQIALAKEELNIS